jgi:hypothetical protein
MDKGTRARLLRVSVVVLELDLYVKGFSSRDRNRSSTGIV